MGIEAIKYMLQGRFGNSGPVIANGEADLMVILRHPYADHGTAGRMLNRVLDQIADGLLEKNKITTNFKVIGCINSQSHGPRFGNHLPLIQHRIEDFTYVYVFSLSKVNPLFEGSDTQYPSSDIAHDPNLGKDIFDQIQALTLRGCHPEAFGMQGNRTERVLQFMSQIGNNAFDMTLLRERLQKMVKQVADPSKALTS